MTRTALRIPDGWADPLLAAVLLVICEVEVVAAADARDARSLAAFVAAAALTVPLVWRRRAPLAVACIVMFAVVSLAAALPGFNTLTTPMFVLFIPRTPLPPTSAGGRRWPGSGSVSPARSLSMSCILRA